MISNAKLLIPAAALASAAVIASTPAHAQSKGGDRVNMVIAYSEDECPEQTEEGEIVVCQILVEAERYRIPSNLRASDSPQNVSRVKEVEKLKYVGDFGAYSCSPAGAGGFTGCTEKFIESAYQEKSEAETIRFSQLIEAQRQERLSTIDASAAEMQERVEQIEREYLERLEQERNAPLPGESAEGPVEGVEPSPDAPTTEQTGPEQTAPVDRAPPPPVVGPTLTPDEGG
ncbi:MAG: hypothetical protein AAFY19_03325 [Pseudomonadota bacterium]